jgi:hypothetical protein
MKSKHLLAASLIALSSLSFSASEGYAFGVTHVAPSNPAQPQGLTCAWSQPELIAGPWPGGLSGQVASNQKGQSLITWEQNPQTLASINNGNGIWTQSVISNDLQDSPRVLLVDNQGNMTVIFQNSVTNSLKAARWNGSAWVMQTIMTDFNGISLDAAVVPATGNIYVAASRYENAKARLDFVKYNAAANTWEAPIPLTYPSTSGPGSISIAANNAGDAIIGFNDYVVGPNHISSVDQRFQMAVLKNGIWLPLSSFYEKAYSAGNNIAIDESGRGFAVFYTYDQWGAYEYTYASHFDNNQWSAPTLLMQNPTAPWPAGTPSLKGVSVDGLGNGYVALLKKAPVYPNPATLVLSTFKVNTGTWSAAVPVENDPVYVVAEVRHSHHANGLTILGFETNSATSSLDLYATQLTPRPQSPQPIDNNSNSGAYDLHFANNGPNSTLAVFATSQPGQVRLYKRTCN